MARKGAQSGYALYDGVSGRAIVLELHASLVAHAHSETQIAFWLGGAPTVAHVGSQVFRYAEDTALAFNAHEMHDAVLEDDGRPSFFLAFMISKAWLDERRRATGHTYNFKSPRVPVDHRLREACWRVLDLIVSGAPRASIDEEVERLLNAAISASSNGAQAERRPSIPLLDRRLRAAIAYMREHVADKQTIDAIANGVGMSRAHLFALFREQLNTTPQVFWSAVRVEEAMLRLIDQGGSLIDLALDLGFSAPGNFSRFFKEHTGVSPSTFRRAAVELQSNRSIGAVANESRAPVNSPLTGLPR